MQESQLMVRSELQALHRSSKLHAESVKPEEATYISVVNGSFSSC